MIYPSESSSTLSGYHTGNRSRANTGGEDNSSLSSSDTKKIPALATKTGRRRSHRPRGCRGGRKNRKKQQANAAVPKEIGPLSPKENNGDRRASASALTRSALVPQQQQQPGMPQRMLTKSFWGRAPSATKQDENHGRGAQSTAVRDGASFVTPAAPSSYSRLVSNSSATTATASRSASLLTTAVPEASAAFTSFTDGPHSNDTGDAYLFRPVQDNTAPVVYEHSAFTPSMQLPFERRKSSNLLAAGHSKLPFNQDQRGMILPPPPIVERDSPTFDGPNPYALATSTTDDSIEDQRFAPPSYSETVKRSDSDSSSSTDESYDFYRNQRLEKQRQMMADGGSSLFAISPRSFLMGGSMEAAR